ncbi:MAG: hypothetical protein WKF47_07530 [Geodermatophilaceae bacterium]
MRRPPRDPRRDLLKELETSDRQVPQTLETVARNGLIPRVARSDELDATAIIGTRPALQSGPVG